MTRALAMMGLLSILGVGTAAAQSDKPAGERVCTLKVERMACGACAARVEREAGKIEGVKAAKVSQPKGTAEITYDPDKTTADAIAKAITERTGFKSQVSEPKRKEAR